MHSLKLTCPSDHSFTQALTRPEGHLLPVDLVTTHIFLEILSLGLLNACQNCLENASPVPDATGVTHTSPGQRPGLIGQKAFPSAEGAIHRGMSQAVGLGPKQIARG